MRRGQLNAASDATELAHGYPQSSDRPLTWSAMMVDAMCPAHHAVAQAPPSYLLSHLVSDACTINHACCYYAYHPFTWWPPGGAPAVLRAHLRKTAVRDMEQRL